MNANLKSILTAAGTLCAAAFLLSACATTTEMPPELEPEDYVGSELKTTNSAYAEDSNEEYRVLKNGFGETQEAAIKDARKNAETEMGEKIDLLLRSVPAGTDARERARAALLAAMRTSAPDMWDFRVPGAARHKATIGAALRKDAVREKLRELEELGKRAPRLAPPLEAVEIGAERFPATVAGVKSKFRHDEIAEIFVTPENGMFLTIFSVNPEKQALIIPFDDGKNSRRLRAGEKLGLRIAFAVEDAGKHQENGQLIFVLTKSEPDFRAAGKNEIFSSDDVAAWLNAFPPNERFVRQIVFDIER